MAPANQQPPQQPKPLVVLCKDGGEGEDEEFLFSMLGEGEEGEDGDYEFNDEISDDDFDFDDEEDIYGDEKDQEAAGGEDDEVAAPVAQKRSAADGDHGADEEAESRQLTK